MDKRRRPNPKLRVGALIATLVVLVSMAIAISTSAAHTEIVRPTLEVSSIPRQVALDLSASDAVFISRQDQEKAIRRIVRSKQPLYCGGTKDYASVTFDDGPSTTTPELLKLLKAEGLPVTWFNLGNNSNAMPAELKAQADYAPLANHTWSHTNLAGLSNADIKKELGDTQELFVQETGQNWKIMRPPYGARDEGSSKMIRKLGYVEALWSADSQDALGKDAKAIAENAIDGIGPGAILLFHDGPAATLTALKKRVFAAMRKSKVTFVSLQDLLVLNPPSRAQLDQGATGCAHAGKRNVSGGGAATYEEG